MKKTLPSLLAVLAFGSCALSGATVLFSDNFESGDFSSPTGEGATWATVNQPLNGELSVSDVNPIAGTYSAYMNEVSSTGATGDLVGVFAGSDTFGSTVSGSVKIIATDAANFSGYFAFRNGFTNVARIRFLQSSGAIQYEKVANSWVTIQGYTSGVTYDITVDLDFTTDTYDVSVNGTSMVSDLAMLNESDGINRFSLTGGLVAGSTGKFHLDDVQITAIPEPASTAALAGFGILLIGVARRTGSRRHAPGAKDNG